MRRSISHSYIKQRDNGVAFWSSYGGDSVLSFIFSRLLKGPFIATQLNWTQLTQLNSVQPSQSCFCLWHHDLQTESTGSPRSLIGDSCSRCERVDNSTSSWVELCRYKHPFRERKIADKKYDRPGPVAALGLLICEIQCRHPPYWLQSLSLK